MDQPYLQKDLGEHWRIIYPETIDLYDELFDEALELMEQAPAKAERMLKKIITACGNGQLDALLHLGLLFNDRNKKIEGNAMIIRAHQVAKEAIPDDFILGYDQIYWSHLDNRPLLGVFQAQGLELMKMAEYGKAIREFDFLLRVNPGDNQGARFNMLECFQRLGHPEDVIDLEHEYERDYSVEFYYGKLLALLQLGRLQEAVIQLAAAKAAFPYVAEELVKTEHKFPFDEFDRSYILEGVYPLGSRQEAYNYWCKTKGLLEKDEKINEFLTKNTAA